MPVSACPWRPPGSTPSTPPNAPARPPTWPPATPPRPSGPGRSAAPAWPGCTAAWPTVCSRPAGTRRRWPTRWRSGPSTTSGWGRGRPPRHACAGPPTSSLASGSRATGTSARRCWPWPTATGAATAGRRPASPRWRHRRETATTWSRCTGAWPGGPRRCSGSTRTPGRRWSCWRRAGRCWPTSRPWSGCGSTPGSAWSTCGPAATRGRRGGRGRAGRGGPGRDAQGVARGGAHRPGRGRPGAGGARP